MIEKICEATYGVTGQELPARIGKAALTWQVDFAEKTQCLLVYSLFAGKNNLQPARGGTTRRNNFPATIIDSRWRFSTIGDCQP